MFSLLKKKKVLPNVGKLCECPGNISFKRSTHHEGFPLQGGFHTSFILGKCENCGGFAGFPLSNLELAVKEASEEGKKILLELGFTLNES